MTSEEVGDIERYQQDIDKERGESSSDAAPL
jgi:hypothetical protein